MSAIWPILFKSNFCFGEVVEKPFMCSILPNIIIDKDKFAYERETHPALEDSEQRTIYTRKEGTTF